MASATTQRLNIDIKKLKDEQLKLSKKVIVKDVPIEISKIGGCDQTYAKGKVICVITVLSYPDLKLVEKKYTIKDVEIPYMMGYLFYSEGPAIIETYNKLENKPDLLMVDGSGILHPRRIGIASQLGLVLDTQTIGLTKNMLCGELRNDKVYINDEVRGQLVVTKPGGNPIFVSPGHKITLKKAVKLVKETVKLPYKMPEPLALAHKFANKLKKFQKGKEPSE